MVFELVSPKVLSAEKREHVFGFGLRTRQHFPIQTHCRLSADLGGGRHGFAFRSIDNGVMCAFYRFCLNSNSILQNFVLIQLGSFSTLIRLSVTSSKLFES